VILGFNSQTRENASLCGNGSMHQRVKRLFYTIVVGATFSVNVFSGSIFKLYIFGL